MMNHVVRKLIRAAHAAVALAYVAAGVFLIFATVDPLGLGTFTRVALGFVVFVYGLFRLVRAFRQTPVLA